MNSVFIDSNVIIKYFTGDLLTKKLLEPIIYGDTVGYVNTIVISEVIFSLLKLLTSKKAYELKRIARKP